MENGEWRCVTTCLTAVIIFMDSEIRFEIKYFPFIRLIRHTKVLQIQCSADSVSLVDGEGGAAEQDGEDVSTVQYSTVQYLSRMVRMSTLPDTAAAISAVSPFRPAAQFTSTPSRSSWITWQALVSSS